MAHKLALRPGQTEAKDGKKAFAYFGVGEPAWHGLGVTVQEAQNAEQALKLGGLDFEVGAFPTQTVIPSLVKGQPDLVIPVDGKWTTVRTDTNQPLGVVGDTYHVMQNVDLLRALDPIVERGEAVYQTAGVIDGGKRVWLMAKLPEHYSIRVGENDLTEMFVLIYGSHDGSTSNVVALTPIRVVCNNTLTAALKGTKNKVLVRHTRNAKQALDEAHKILGISNNYAKEMQEVFNRMAHTPVNKVKLDKFVLDLLPKANDKSEVMTMGEKQRRMLVQNFESGRGSNLVTARGTVFGLYNAATEMLDHTKGYEDANGRAKSIWFGGSSLKRQEAFDLCLDLIK